MSAISCIRFKDVFRVILCKGFFVSLYKHDRMNSQIIIAALAALVITLATSDVASQGPKNLVPNPGFEQGFDGWEAKSQADYAVDSDVKFSGKCSARITVSRDRPLEYQNVAYSMPVKPGEEYVATFQVKCKYLKDGAGAYGVLEFCRDEKRVSVVQTAGTRAEIWHLESVEGKVPPGANRMRLALISHAYGTTWFDDVRLWIPEPQPIKAEFTLQANKIITDNWQGFGSQGDLFLYRQRTIDEGITDADRELVRKRILTMRPQIVRLLFNVSDWENERGKPTPDGEAMKDLRETIAIYQEAGTDVHLTEWGWAPPPWCRPIGRLPHPDERRAFTDSFAAAVKYLRNDCGFKNVRYVTFCNEPNINEISWEDYASIYRNLDESLKAAGLRKDVVILGPDEVYSYDLMYNAVTQLDDVIDCYSFHNYASDTGRHFAACVQPRVALLPKVKSSGLNPPRKRVVIAEFGMHDRMDTFSTPHNHEYEYGVFLADCAIEAAREGVSAMMMWCLMDTNYGVRMKWGLWRFKDEDWEPRPGFYSWSLLTRYTEKGSTIHPLACDVNDVSSVAFRAPNNGPWTLLTVNRRKTARPFTMTGLPPKSRWESYIYCRKSVPTPDSKMIRPGEVMQAGTDGTLKGSMPARSFILWRQVTN